MKHMNILQVGANMFIANFLTLEKTNYNVQVSFFDYLHYLINKKSFLEKLSKEYRTDFFGSFYFKGVFYVRNNIW